MIKKYKKQLIISSIVILLPILVGLILWNRLPDTIATHWGFSGEADGWSTKAFAIFTIPLLLLATHWFCFWVTTRDPKSKNQSKKAFGMIFWICPAISLLESSAVYALALGSEFSIGSLTFGMVGLMFIGIGNYLPKCKQNYTLGIKVPWALSNEENWNATHRFSGKLWVIGGFALVLAAFLPAELTISLMVMILLVMCFVPMLYSWLYYRRQIKNGAVDASKPQSKEEKMNAAIMKGTLIFVAAVFVIVGYLLFSGHIDVIYSEDAFTIEASYWDDLTVNYSEVESIEYREGNVDGTRTWGLGSWKLLLGAFENEEFGNYTRYTYYRPEACVILTVSGKTLVVSGENAAETKAIYAELIARMEG